MVWGDVWGVAGSDFVHTIQGGVVGSKDAMCTAQSGMELPFASAHEIPGTTK